MEVLHSREVVQPVFNHKRSIPEENIWMGYPFDVIRSQVIRAGLADFQEGHSHSKHGELSADNKASLYCFVNMKRHLFECIEMFRRYREPLSTIFESTRTKLVIDLGCGPGTAGLALAECFERPKFAYVGLDRARPMLRKAESVLNSAIRDSLLPGSCRVATTSSWSRLQEGLAEIKKPANVLVNASYLFASDSLDVDEVCRVITQLRDNESVKRLLLTYSNSTIKQAGVKFTRFKRNLRGMFNTNGLKRKTFSYHRKRTGAIDTVTYLRQMLIFKEE